MLYGTNGCPPEVTNLNYCCIAFRSFVHFTAFTSSRVIYLLNFQQVKLVNSVYYAT